MMITSGRRLARMSAVSAMAIGFGLGVGQATLLSPGGTVSMRFAAEPDDGHLLAQTNFTFGAGAFAGSLTSQVWECDESNPWGGLTFAYQISNSSACTESLGLFALLGFTDSLIDVNYSGSGIAPRQASRAVDGNKVTFGFFDRHGQETLLPGGVSAWVVIQTSGHTWGLNQLIGLDAEQVLAPTFAPVAVPEPAVVSLIGLAVGIGWRRRCRRAA